MYITEDRYADIENLMNFHRKILGPILPHKDPMIDPQAWEFCDEILDMLIEDNGLHEFDIMYAIINSESKNACCSKRPSGLRIILISRGLIESLKKSASYLISCPTYSQLKNLDDSLSIDMPSRKSNGDFEGLPDIPDFSELQKIEVNQLTALGLAFIISHEIAHLKNGHLAIRSIIDNKYSCDKNNENKFTTFQAMERDADCFACNAIYHFIHKKYFNVIYAFDITGWMEFCTVMITTIAAVAIFDFNLIHLEDISIRFRSEGYPNSIIRLFSATSTILRLNAFKYSLEENEDYYGETSKNILPIFSYAFMLSMYGSTKDEIIIFKENFEQYNDSYHDKMLRRYATIYPILAANKIGNGNLAPVQREAEDLDLGEIAP